MQNNILLPYSPKPCDKSTWPQGPWQQEADIKTWHDISTGYACAALRHNRLGNFCGYVLVPEDHPLRHTDYTARAKFPKEWHERRINIEQDIGYMSAFCASINAADDLSEATLDLIFHCHGGLTYSKDGWFGFDCGHAGDRSPGLSSYNGEVYRDLLYVTVQCERLAQQLHDYVKLVEAPNVDT